MDNWTLGTKGLTQSVQKIEFKKEMGQTGINILILHSTNQPNQHAKNHQESHCSYSRGG